MSPSFLARALTVSVVVAATMGCGSRRDEFIGGRAQDACNEVWPVCDTVVGCVLGAHSFAEGRFPGEARFIVRLTEVSTVHVSVYVDEVESAGETMSITWWEDGCRSRIRETVTGEDFVGEAQRIGFFTRKAELNGLGDHLIEVSSSGEASFIVKVDVVPRRLQAATE